MKCTTKNIPQPNKPTPDKKFDILKNLKKYRLLRKQKFLFPRVTLGPPCPISTRLVFLARFGYSQKGFAKVRYGQHGFSWVWIWLARLQRVSVLG